MRNSENETKAFGIIRDIYFDRLVTVYDNKKTYNVGEHCIYEGIKYISKYRNTNNHPENNKKSWIEVESDELIRYDKYKNDIYRY